MEQPSLFDPAPILLTIPEAARMMSIGRTLAYELIAAASWRWCASTGRHA
jgi:hypothetical protein